MRLVIDYQKCLKSGQCSYLHAELIKADPDGTPRVIVEKIGEDLRAAAEDVVDLCPSGAISLVDE
jgi:ferredoxin